MSNFYTPLRYPGGKGKLSDYLKSIFEVNNLCDGHYIEPYAGGAGIALNLLINEYASHIHLNDLNYPVYSFWHSVLNDTENFCKKIRNCKITTNSWQLKRNIIRNHESHSQLDVGFALFFLNRTNRSGIISAGAIGGKSQDGDWKIDARFNKVSLIDRIEKIADYKHKISIYNLDAVELIKHVIPCLPKKTLVYLDPPYYVKGQRLYDNHYQHEDHKKIAELVQTKISRPWLVSYDNNETISKLYKDKRQHVYGLNYSAAKSYVGSELFIYSDEIILPTPNNPIAIKAA